MSVARHSSRITPHSADVTNADDQDALAEAFSKLPSPRALFHGAGYFQLGQLHTLPSEDWRRSFDTNVTARWALSSKCADDLVGGRILFVGSDSGANVRVGAAAYSIAQSASETLRRALQAEWSHRDIAVAGFKPGLVDTDLVQGLLAAPEAEFPSRISFQNYIDSGECASPEKIAVFAAWLMLDVETTRFAATEWDIRKTDHHSEWLKGQLYDRNQG